MAWETPDDFIEGQLVTQANMQQISDNLEALYAPPSDQAVLDDVANYTATGTAWADIDASLNVQVVSTGGAVEVGFHTSIANGGAGNPAIYLDLELTTNGTVVGRIGADDGIILWSQTTAGLIASVGFVRRITGLSAGTHVFSPQIKQSGGTSTIYAGSGAQTSVHGQLWAVER